MAKPKEAYKETFKKGVFVGNNEILKILKDNKDGMSIELNNRGTMTDGSEFMTVKINLKKD